ncbi:MAG: hypothetical protein QXZ13_03255 [Candidatus Diapherotrites archaeon]
METLKKPRLVFEGNLELSFNNERELDDYIREKIGDDIKYSFGSYKPFLEAALFYLLMHYDECSFAGVATKVLRNKIEKIKNIELQFNEQSLLGFVSDFHEKCLFVFENEKQMDSKLEKLGNLIRENRVSGYFYPWPMIFSMFRFYLEMNKDKCFSKVPRGFKPVINSGEITRFSDEIYSKLRKVGFKPVHVNVETIRQRIAALVNKLGFKIERGGYRPRKVRDKVRGPKGTFPSREIADHVANFVKGKGLGYPKRPTIRH